MSAVTNSCHITHIGVPYVSDFKAKDENDLVKLIDQLNLNGEGGENEKEATPPHMDVSAVTAQEGHAWKDEQ